MNSTMTSPKRVKCHDCGCSDATTVYAARPGVVVRRCASCGLRFLQEWATDFNPELYRYYDDRQPRLEIDRLNSLRYCELLSDFSSISNGRRLLDIGCGEGKFVAVAKELGWAATGIDLAPGAIRSATARGVRATCADIYDSSLDGEKYHVLTMLEFIEHVPAPSRVVARAAQLLAPGGVLYLTTPNFASIDRLALGAAWSPFHPEHLSYFTPKQLRHVLSKSGLFRDIRIHSRNISVGTIIRGIRKGTTVDSGGVAIEQAIRGRVESSRPLQLLKTSINGLLRLTGGGSTIIARMIRTDR